MRSRVVVSAFLSSMMVLGAGTVSAQDYPNKPIRILTSGAGGASDILARLIGQIEGFGGYHCTAYRAGSGIAHDSGLGPAWLSSGVSQWRICACQNARSDHQPAEPGDGAGAQQGGSEREISRHRARDSRQLAGGVRCRDKIRHGENGQGHQGCVDPRR